MDSSASVVLVAEDETLIRMMAADMLADAGFTVVEAASSDEALAALRVHAGHVATLFTDIDMPGGMTGLELARAARREWPGIAILVTSGLHQPLARDLPPGGRFIPKPYRPEHVIAHIHALTRPTDTP